MIYGRIYGFFEIAVFYGKKPDFFYESTDFVVLSSATNPHPRLSARGISRAPSDIIPNEEMNRGVLAVKRRSDRIILMKVALNGEIINIMSA